MANAALQNQGHNSLQDQRLEIVNNRNGNQGKVTQGFAPALSREQYSIGPKGTVATVRKVGGIGFKPEGGAK